MTMLRTIAERAMLAVSDPHLSAAQYRSALADICALALSAVETATPDPAIGKPPEGSQGSGSALVTPYFVTDYEDGRPIRIAQAPTALRTVVEQMVANHRDCEAAEYNECDLVPCPWCVSARAALGAAQ
jgi:hypothetical protein